VIVELVEAGVEVVARRTFILVLHVLPVARDERGSAYLPTSFYPATDLADICCLREEKCLFSIP
jgi:hypothetical protein